jgi:hypothetical protein
MYCKAIVLLVCIGVLISNPIELGPFEAHLPHHDHTATSAKPLQAVLVDCCGDTRSCAVVKHELASELNLPLRDLRLVDPSFPGQTQAAFAARPQAVLFALEDIKVVVHDHQAAVFGPAQADAMAFISALQAQLRINCRTSAVMRFEHKVIETALSIVCSKLQCQVRSLSPSITAALQELHAQSKGLDVIQTQVRALPYQQLDHSSVLRPCKRCRPNISFPCTSCRWTACCL